MWEAMAAAGLASVMMLTLALAGTANSADITFAPYASNQFTAGCLGNLGLCDFGGLMYQPALSRFIVDANVGPIVAGKLYTFPAAGGVNSATAFAQSTGIADLTSLFETNIVFSTGLGGFNNNDVFVSAGCKIYDIAPDGSSATLLATVPGGFTKYVGLVMDTTVNNPPFNNNLVAVTPDGNAFTITSAGVVTLVGNFGVVEGESPMGTPPPGTNAGFEQPVIIPPSQSSPIAGQLVVAAEQNDVVLAMSKAGVVTTVASTATGLPTFFGSPQFGMETLLLLPPTIGTAGVPDGLFTIQSGDNILYNAPSSQFTGLQNRLITGSEFSDVWVDMDISVNPAVVTTHTLDLNGLPLGTDNLIEQQWVFVNAPVACTDTSLTWGYWKNHTGSGSPRQDPAYKKLSSTCPAVGGVGAVSLDGDCDNASDSFKPTVITCAKKATCGAQSADALFAGGNGGKVNCSGKCVTLFAAQLLAAEMNVVGNPALGGAIYVNPADPQFSGQTLSQVLSELESSFDVFVDGGAISCGGVSGSFSGCQNTLDAINNSSESTHTLNCGGG